jgi:hypothetical protein
MTTIGGVGDMEAQVRVLETHIEYVRENIARLVQASDAARSDINSIRADVGVLKESVSHLPSKGFIVTAVSTALVIAIGALTLLARFGIFAPVR